MTRHILAFLLACAAAAAQAQPAAPASAASAAETITPGTACGAAGVGNAWRYPPGSTRREPVLTVRPADTAARPGGWSKRVDDAGTWVACLMPRPPTACAARAVVSWGRCRPMSDPPGQPRTLPAAPLGQRATVIDQEWMGRQTWECRTITPGPARWVPTDGYCRR